MQVNSTYVHCFVYHFGYFIEQYGDWTEGNLWWEVKKSAMDAAQIRGREDQATIHVVMRNEIALFAVMLNGASKQSGSTL